MGQVSISLNLFADANAIIEVSDDKPVSDILSVLLQHIGQQQNRVITQDKLLILVSHPVTDFDSTLSELGVGTGDFLTIVQLNVRPANTALLLTAPHDTQQAFKITRSPATLGRAQDTDINITTLLPDDAQRTVSRHQAVLIEENGEWIVQLHEEATSPMFIDGQRLSANKPLTLAAGNVLAFGLNPNEPALQLVVQFEGEAGTQHIGEEQKIGSNSQ